MHAKPISTCLAVRSHKGRSMHLQMHKKVHQPFFRCPLSPTARQPPSRFDERCSFSTNSRTNYFSILYFRIAFVYAFCIFSSSRHLPVQRTIRCPIRATICRSKSHSFAILSVRLQLRILRFHPCVNVRG